MTDLEINIALAKAMGWVKYNRMNPNGSFKAEDGRFYCCSEWHWREFSYLDPVIFVAICKHWRLVVNFDGWVSRGIGVEVIGNWCRECIEQAAALTVIDAVKRGVK